MLVYDTLSIIAPVAVVAVIDSHKCDVSVKEHTWDELGLELEVEVELEVEAELEPVVVVVWLVVEVVDSVSSSSCKSLAISARASVKFSISSISGTSALTESTKLLTTFTAQLISLVTSPTASFMAPAMLGMMLLSYSKARNCLSDNAFLFLFVLEQSGSGGLTLKSFNKAMASSFVFSTSSRNWDFSFGFVSHCLLAWRAKNSCPRYNDSEVACAAAIVLVGMSNHTKEAGEDDESVHIPLKVIGTCEDKDAVVVGKGKMPIPGTDAEDGKRDNIVPFELELLDKVAVENVVHMKEVELVRLVWLLGLVGLIELVGLMELVALDWSDERINPGAELVGAEIGVAEIVGAELVGAELVRAELVVAELITLLGLLEDGPPELTRIVVVKARLFELLKILEVWKRLVVTLEATIILGLETAFVVEVTLFKLLGLLEASMSEFVKVSELWVMFVVERKLFELL
jgi:hypothetical protein